MVNPWQQPTHANYLCRGQHLPYASSDLTRYSSKISRILNCYDPGSLANASVKGHLIPNTRTKVRGFDVALIPQGHATIILLSSFLAYPCTGCRWLLHSDQIYVDQSLPLTSPREDLLDSLRLGKDPVIVFLQSTPYAPCLTTKTLGPLLQHI